MDTMLIQLTNQKALKLIHELEELHLIKVIEQNIAPVAKLSQKYKGIINSTEARALNEHIKQMRSEWNDI